MITTVVPAWNEPADRLTATVVSALECTDHVVVCDDGSRDPISLAMERVTVVRQPNAGPAAAMNTGAHEALTLGSTRIARLDVGDFFRAAEKRRQLAVTAPAICSPHWDLVEAKAFAPLPHWKRAIYWDGAFCIDTCVVTADVWKDSGGFDVSLRYGGDWDWAMRVHHHVGWEMYHEVTCDAGAFPGGHTKGADEHPVRRMRKHDDMMVVLARGKLLRRPA